EPLTRGGAVVGTAGYMAPEQARGAAVDARADVFALGCVLHECLTGRPAFSAAGGAATLARLLAADAPRARAPRPDLPEELERLIARMLAKEPDGRPDAAAVLAALDAPAPARGVILAELGSAPTLALGDVAAAHGGWVATIADGSAVVTLPL